MLPVRVRGCGALSALALSFTLAGAASGAESRETGHPREAFWIEGFYRRLMESEIVLKGSVNPGTETALASDDSLLVRRGTVRVTATLKGTVRLNESIPFRSIREAPPKPNPNRGPNDLASPALRLTSSQSTYNSIEPWNYAAPLLMDATPAIVIARGRNTDGTLKLALWKGYGGGFAWSGVIPVARKSGTQELPDAVGLILDSAKNGPEGFTTSALFDAIRKSKSDVLTRILVDEALLEEVAKAERLNKLLKQHVIPAIHSGDEPILRRKWLLDTLRSAKPEAIGEGPFESIVRECIGIWRDSRQHIRLRDAALTFLYANRDRIKNDRNQASDVRKALVDQSNELGAGPVIRLWDGETIGTSLNFIKIQPHREELLRDLP